MKIKHPIVWVILSIITCNISILFLGKKLNVYEKNAWYTKWYYWVLGALFGILPALVMFGIFMIQTNVKICALFDVGGKEIYTLPYVWIAFFIIPIIGWTLFIVLLLYIYIMYLINLFSYRG
ncbi:MAG: hypothetical protein IKG40_02960 [Bacilli bacterium]|nr:hypothetical protein [Bacilli bacterium]